MTATATRWSGSATRLPVRDLIARLLDGDVGGAGALTDRVLEQTASRTAVFADLLHPAQAEIADLWYAGRIGVADEVRAAAAVRRIVGRLAPTPVDRPVARGSRCVLAVPHRDPHDLGLLMLTLALQDHGWSTEVLGPVSGLADVADVVLSRRPRLFGLSAGHLPPLQQVERTIAAIKRAGVPVLVGGAAFIRRPDLWRRVGADGLGTDVRIGVVLAQRLCGR
ncbi:MAG TPA: cobalamin-dependent protein [Candidatus Dormibacteraeota bacterium]|nr:cobalamin-dependent protein [Candidatus Dormibacteraeota bacterium]